MTETTFTAEQADEVVSIVQSVDVESLSTDDQLTIINVWEYISRTLDIPLIVKTHKCVSAEIAYCVQQIPYDKYGPTNRFNDTDELFTALRPLLETVETT